MVCAVVCPSGMCQEYVPVVCARGMCRMCLAPPLAGTYSYPPLRTYDRCFGIGMCINDWLFMRRTYDFESSAHTAHTLAQAVAHTKLFRIYRKMCGTYFARAVAHTSWCARTYCAHTNIGLHIPFVFAKNLLLGLRASPNKVAQPANLDLAIRT